MFNATVVETVSNLVGRTALTIWNAEQILHLAQIEVGYTPSANLLRRA